MKGASLWSGFLVLTLLLMIGGQAAAQNESTSIESPRWSYEIRAGSYLPDLELFETFYGDDKEDYYGLAVSYRFKEWLEIGGEYAQMRTKGVGILTSTQVLGGSVTYRLNPAHIYSNLIFQRSGVQRIVPYVGVGLTVAEYKQDVAVQGSIDGHTDLGYSARLGVRLLVGSQRPAVTAISDRNPDWRGYIFLEAQQISAEVDNIELGGRSYMLGFRMEFNP
jgi:hypothetical protein